MTTGNKLPSFVAVPSEIIDEHLGRVSGIYIKVILYILRANAIDPPCIAKALSVPVSEVEEAVHYWCGCGILPEEEVNAQLQAAKKRREEDKKAALPTPSPEAVRAVDFAQSAKREDVRFLLTTAEQILGRPLNSTEQKGYVFFLEDYDMPADVIVMAIEFCAMHGRANYKYVSKMLAGWHDEGINTHPLAEEYIRVRTERLNHEAEIMETFGIKNRGLTTSNRKYIMQWYDDYGFDIEMIRMAYERAIDQIGQPSFAYIGKILQNWHEMGLKTPQDVIEKDLPKRKNNKNNNDDRSYDIDEFDRQGFDLPDFQ